MPEQKPRTLPAISSYRVFVSHATADKWLATVLCEKIESVGAQTFRDDRDIDGGEDIPDGIRLAIDGADEMLVLLTPESVGRPWVLMEIGAAWHRDTMRITAVRQHVGIEPIPAMLKSKRVLDLNEFPRYLDDLGRRLKGRR